MRTCICRHRLDPYEDSHCGLIDENGTYLVAKESGLPVFCDAKTAKNCLLREGDEKQLESCPFCHKRHYSGSGAQKLCRERRNVNEAFKEMRKEFPDPPRYYAEGTRKPVYTDWTEEWIRSHLWSNIRSRVLRRDAHTCQDCGEIFGKRSRRVYDPSLRKGKGGYRKESLEVHHIIPRSLGGSDHPGNLKTLCPLCHKKYSELHMSRCRNKFDHEEECYDPWDE